MLVMVVRTENVLDVVVAVNIVVVDVIIVGIVVLVDANLRALVIHGIFIGRSTSFQRCCKRKMAILHFYRYFFKSLKVVAVHGLAEVL